MISLYRGELHKVSGITRQWPLPKPSITLSAFRQALEKRNDALRGKGGPYLTRQDTCVSGSHNVSPAAAHLRGASREEPETDIVGREGRGESDGHVKAEYMDEDVEEEDRDGSAAPMEESSARVVRVRGEREPESADLEDRKERKKRKLEEASLMEARKGKLKVKVKEELAAAAAAADAAAAGASERMALDAAAGPSDVMEVEGAKEGGPETVPELLLPITPVDVKMEVNDDERDGDFVKVEAPPTPPVHSEEQNFSKPVEGKDHNVEHVKATDDAATGDKKTKKAELEAKLKELTAEKHRLVQMLKQVLTTEKESKKRVQSASQSPSAPGPPSSAPGPPPSSAPGPGPSSSCAPQGIPSSSTDAPAAPETTTTITSAGGAEVTTHKVDVPSSHLVRPNRFGRHLTSSRHVQVLSTEEESKKKVHNCAAQSPPAPVPAQAAAPSSADAPAAAQKDPAAAAAGASEAQPSADLEEGELEYARTPSPPSHTTTSSHPGGHGTHPQGSAPSLGPLLGRQPHPLNQGGPARGNYYQQGLSLPSPSSAAAAAALAGAISPGTGFMPLALGGRPNYQHQMGMMQHVAAIHAQKVAVAAAAAAAGHSHPILGGGGPAGAGNGVNSGPPGFGGYGVSPSVHGHHGHMSQGASPGAGHIAAAQQGVASPSLLTTPRG